MKTLCVVSMSGGLDSTTLAFKALSEGYTILPVNINYGQKNIVEMTAFKNIINYLQTQPLYKKNILEPIVLDMDSFMKPVLSSWQEMRDSGQMKEKTNLEFYTPSRNLLFSSLATVIGEIIALGLDYNKIKIGLGIHKHTMYDRDYWDIKPQFAKTFDALLALNDCADIELYAPYANKFKKDIIEDAYKMNVPWELTWTCYDPIIENNIAKPCQKCEACIERQKAGDEGGIPSINEYFITL
jgi:7-cyano-7-deazaguanine synthase